MNSREFIIDWASWLMSSRNHPVSSLLWLAFWMPSLFMGPGDPCSVSTSHLFSGSPKELTSARGHLLYPASQVLVCERHSASPFIYTRKYWVQWHLIFSQCIFPPVGKYGKANYNEFLFIFFLLLKTHFFI